MGDQPRDVAVNMPASAPTAAEPIAVMPLGTALPQSTATSEQTMESEIAIPREYCDYPVESRITPVGVDEL